MVEDGLYAGVTLGLADHALAPEVARQILAVLKGERRSAPLVESARLARAVGLSVAEMERMSGYTRQTIYSALKAADSRTPRMFAADRSMLARQVLVVLCSMGGEVRASELAARLALPLEDVARALQTLAAEKLCDLHAHGASEVEKLSASPTPQGMQTLRAVFDELYVRQPDGFAVYLRVDPEEAAAIAAAAGRVVSAHEHTVMAPQVAPSVMSTPELALTVHAPTSRAAISIATDLWHEVRTAGGLAPQAARISDVIPPSTLPCGESQVLDAFTDAVISEAISRADDLRRERMRYRGGAEERALTGRCLTSAARALRRSLFQERDPRPITDAESAFGELTIVSGTPIEASAQPVQELVTQALQLAADQLGPFRGGEMAAFSTSSGQPRLAAPVQPSQDDLTKMASLAGEAVGKATKLDRIDPVLELRAIVNPFA